jgi:hypothetical protein
MALMRDAGAQSEPEITFIAAVSSPDQFLGNASPPCAAPCAVPRVGNGPQPLRSLCGNLRGNIRHPGDAL